eukprot:COSAG01_NODE_12895_length_1668_cov_0.801785_1_plen_421_part_10
MAAEPAARLAGEPAVLVASQNQAKAALEIIEATVATLPSLVSARHRARRVGTAAAAAADWSNADGAALFDLRTATRCRVAKPCGRLYDESCQLDGSPVELHFWPAAAQLLRNAYHRRRAGVGPPNGPERLAAPLWATIGDQQRHGSCWRMAIHWRTTSWSLTNRDDQQGLTRLLLRTLGGGGGGGGGATFCVRVALIAQYKEDRAAEIKAHQFVSALLTELNAPTSPHAAREFTSRSDYGRANDATDDAQQIARDLALMATAHVLVVGKSQFSWLATGLQRTDGVHIVADNEYYVRPQPCGALPPRSQAVHCQGTAGRLAASKTTDVTHNASAIFSDGPTPCLLLPNTVLAADVRARALAAVASVSSGADPMARFIADVRDTSLRTTLNAEFKQLCPDYLLPASVDDDHAHESLLPSASAI